MVVIGNLNESILSLICLMLKIKLTRWWPYFWLFTTFHTTDYSPRLYVTVFFICRQLLWTNWGVNCLLRQQLLGPTTTNHNQRYHSSQNTPISQWMTSRHTRLWRHTDNHRWDHRLCDCDYEGFLLMSGSRFRRNVFSGDFNGCID